MTKRGRPIRLRIPELLTEHDLTAWHLARQSGGRISTTTAYRLVRDRGLLRSLDTGILEALCDILDIAPSELLTRDAPPTKH